MSEPYFAPGSEAMLALEAMVDRAGLRNVLYALAAVCRTKAERVSHTDHTFSPTEQAWRIEAARLDTTATKIEVHR